MWGMSNMFNFEHIQSDAPIKTLRWRYQRDRKNSAEARNSDMVVIRDWE